jgi:signal transduction histidine kinase
VPRGAADLTRHGWAVVPPAAIVLGLLAERTSGLATVAQVGDLAAGVALMSGGAVALARRSDGRAGALAILAGLLWFAGDVLPALIYAHRGPLVHLLLSDASGAIGSRAGVAVVRAAYVDGLIPSLGRAAVPTLVLAAAVVSVVATHRPAARAGERAKRLMAVGVSAAIGAAAASRLLHAGHDDALLWAYFAAVVGGGAVVAFGGASRADLVGLVIDLGDDHEPSALRAALSRALGDPGLRVVYRLPDGGWADESGRRTRLDGSLTAGRAITYVGDGASPLAALIHDRALVADARLAESMTAVVRVALANAGLQAEITDRMRDVARSRRRLVEAADNERRRLGADVEAGPGRRLAAVEEQLTCEVGPAVATIRAELHDVRRELRRFARGLHPPELSESGLAAALANQTRRSPVPVTLDILDRRLSTTREETLFFVASEALANVAKHAHAARVDIALRASGQRVVLTVADDGIGGADATRGSGLRGLADRVEALDGTMSVTSHDGRGTCVQVELPLT